MLSIEITQRKIEVGRQQKETAAIKRPSDSKRLLSSSCIIHAVPMIISEVSVLFARVLDAQKVKNQDVKCTVKIDLAMDEPKWSLKRIRE